MHGTMYRMSTIEKEELGRFRFGMGQSIYFLKRLMIIFTGHGHLT